MTEGKRFSLNYLERSTPQRDSQRFRNRLASYFNEFLRGNQALNGRIISTIHRETGAVIPTTVVGFSVPDFFKLNEFRDVLDSITIIYQEIKGTLDRRGGRLWFDFVARVLQEENMGYQLDSSGGVHYFIDEEFERNRFATLSMLGYPQYNGVRVAFEDAFQHLDDPMDTKASVRSLFESLEILVKQMVDTQRLNKRIVETKLKDKCLELYSDDLTATKVVTGLFDGFALWVNTLHNYRHGQADQEPIEPPVDVAIYILSSGSSFLRWLIEMNNCLNG